MNDVSVERVESKPAAGQGQRLRARRETRGMSRGEMAAKLHLGEDLVRALEEDDYSSLPDPVFIKGYLRKYARLVEEPEGPLLAAYDQAVPVGTRQTRLAVSGVKQEIRSSHFLVRSISWLIVVGSLALLGLWLKDYFQELAPSLTSAERPLVEAPAPGMEELPSALEPGVSDQPLLAVEEMPLDEAPQEAVVLEDEALALEAVPVVDGGGAPPSAAGTASVRTQTPAPAASGQPAPSAARKPSEAAAQPAPAPAKVAEPAVVSEPPAPAGGSQVVLEIEADSWVDLRDSSGSYRILGNLAKGERHVLEGTPPYSVVLGNSKAVKVTVGGEPFDVAPYTRGNVARFQLDPGQP